VPFVEREGLRLHYVQDGEGDPPLLFVHGWCCDQSYFQPQYDHFRTSHAVAALDLRGCGLSSRPEDGYDIPTLTDDVAWLCSKLGIERPVVVGHSLGGMIAVDLAARHPDIPAAIVAVDPGPIDPTPQAVAMFGELLTQLRSPDGEQARRAYIDRDGIFDPADDTARRREIVETMCAVPIEIASAVIQGVVEWNGVDAITQVRSPILVVLAGPGGSNAPHRLLAHKPDAHIGVTVGTGHFNQLEAADQVSSMIAKFLHVTAVSQALTR
jgi:pimeloyl-ACP methyl ester carboxylesterase